MQTKGLRQLQHKILRSLKQSQLQPKMKHSQPRGGCNAEPSPVADEEETSPVDESQAFETKPKVQEITVAEEAEGLSPAEELEKEPAPTAKEEPNQGNETEELKPTDESQGLELDRFEAEPNPIDQ